MASPFHHHYLNSLCVLRGELNPFKVALTCLATCFSLNAITTVEAGSGKRPAPLKEFAGAYQGNSSIAPTPVKIVGTVRFYRRLVKVTESWNYGAPPLAFTYHIRRR